jgi:hypothetical protein
MDHDLQIDFQTVLILMTQNNVTLYYNVKITYIQKFMVNERVQG